MTDRSTAVSAPASATAEYARVYEEQQPRLVAYARSLTRNAWTAEDLVAEAHFRVWRRLAEGHEIDNVPAYLRTTVRHLAIASGTAVRETPRDPHTEDRAETGAHGEDPAEQVSSVDLVVRVLGQLPERWVKALWLAEAEGQPLAAIGPQLGTKDGATAVLLHRAREGMRQAFLRAQTGAPEDPACQVHWARMPAYVRGAATARQGERLLGHVDACDDCRQTLAALMLTNDRLPALVGPALLVFALGGTGKFLLGFVAGSAGAATAAAGAAGGHGAGLLHGVRQAAIGGSKAPVTATAGALAAGAAAVCLILGGADAAPIPGQRPPVAEAPTLRVPVAEEPPTQTVVRAEAAEDRGPSAPAAGPGQTAPARKAVTNAPATPSDTAGTDDTDDASGGTGTPLPQAPDGDSAEKPAQPEDPAPSADEDTPKAPKPPAPAPETPEPQAPEPETPQTTDPDPGTVDDGDDEGPAADEPGCATGARDSGTGHGAGHGGRRNRSAHTSVTTTTQDVETSLQTR
ncbi:sigma-70 family RNA polymerase sigma factor [Streptomyces sp. NPDC050263]|uniref:sigma-70 family RNA polymerase sigma factor n=1 Tax=Streptomyces sp. NPDC050263 TaxID=3155037 RepID=UPI0034198B7B